MEPDKIAERTQKYDSIVRTLAALKYDSEVSQRLQNATTTYLARTLEDITSETPDFTSMPDSEKMKEAYAAHYAKLSEFVSSSNPNPHGLAHVRVALDTATFPDAEEFKKKVVSVYESKIDELSVLATSDFLSASFSRAEKELRTRSVYGIIDRNSDKILLDKVQDKQAYTAAADSLTRFYGNLKFAEEHSDKKEAVVAVVAKHRVKANEEVKRVNDIFLDTMHAPAQQALAALQSLAKNRKDVVSQKGIVSFVKEFAEMYDSASQTSKGYNVALETARSVLDSIVLWENHAEYEDAAQKMENEGKGSLENQKKWLNERIDELFEIEESDLAKTDEIEESGLAKKGEPMSTLEERLNTFSDCAKELQESATMEAYGVSEEKRKKMLTTRRRTAADFKLLEEYEALEHERNEIPDIPAARAERKALRAWQEKARAYASSLFPLDESDSPSVRTFEIEGILTPVHTSVRDWCDEAVQKLPGYVAEAPRRSSGLFRGAAVLSVAGICYAGAAYGPRLFDLFNSPKPAPAVVTVEPSPDVSPAVPAHLQPPVYDAGFSSVDAATKSAVAAAPAAPAEPALTVEKQLPYTPPKRQVAITKKDSAAPEPPTPLSPKKKSHPKRTPIKPLGKIKTVKW